MVNGVLMGDTIRPSLGCVSSAETIIGLPLYTNDTLPSQLDGDFLKIDVRRYAHHIALRSLAQQRGIILPTSIRDERLLENSQLSVAPNEQELKAIHDELGDSGQQMMRYIALANHLSTAMEQMAVEEYEDPGFQARADVQHNMITNILCDLQMVRVPTCDAFSQPIETTMRTGVMGIGPPGVGKTVIGGAVIKAARCTQKISPDDGRPLGAIVAVPSKELVDQYASDEESNIFRQIIGWDVPIATYDSRNKVLGPVTIITYRSLQIAIEQEIIKRGDFGITFLDEVHHALGPKTFEAVQSICTGVVGATATPAYSVNRDIRKWFPHVESGSLREFAEQGILNPARLLTFQSDGQPDSEMIASQLAARWVETGRKVIVFCQKGQGSMQARRVATMINTLLGDRKAAAVGTFIGNNSEEDTANFKSANLSVLTATGKLIEGLNAEVDAMITIGPNYSEVQLVQKVGRAMRRGKFISLLAEIIPKNLYGRPGLASLWNIFEIENVQQGLLIGHPSQEILEYNGGESGRSPTSVKELDNLIPEHLEKALASPQAVKSILIATEQVTLSEEPPQDYLSLDDLATLYCSSKAHLKKVLEEGGVPSLDIHIRQGRQRATERWYSPQAIEYLKTHPPLRCADPDAMTIGDLSHLTRLTRAFLEKIATKCGAKAEPGLKQDTAHPANIYNGEMVGRILAVVDSIPFAAIDDVPIGVLANELTETFIYTYGVKQGIKPVDKRRYEAHGLKGITMHVSAVQAAQLRKAHEELAATSNHLCFSDIAELAEVLPATVTVRLRPEERAAAVNLRRKGQKKTGNKGKFLPREMALQIVERIRPTLVPQHLVPIAAINNRFSTSKSTIARYLKKLEPTIYRIPTDKGAVSHITCIDWGTLADLDQEYSLAGGQARLYYDKLPHNINEANPVKTTYALLAQAHFRVLRREVWRDVTQVAKALDISIAELQTLLSNLKKEAVRSYEGRIQIAMSATAPLLATMQGVDATPPDEE